jgi:hypothetical protein
VEKVSGWKRWWKRWGGGKGVRYLLPRKTGARETGTPNFRFTDIMASAAQSDGGTLYFCSEHTEAKRKWLRDFSAACRKGEK